TWCRPTSPRWCPTSRPRRPRRRPRPRRAGTRRRARSPSWAWCGWAAPWSASPPPGWPASPSPARSAPPRPRRPRLRGRAGPAPPELQEQAWSLAANMGLARCPTVWLVPGSLPPMVWGLVGAVRVYFPAGLMARLSEEERASLLAHELAHVRRRDHWVRWLE